MKQIRATEIGALVGRLHLLPPEMGRELAAVMAGTENLQLAGALLMDAIRLNADDPEVFTERADALLRAVEEVQKIVERVRLALSGT